MIIWNYRQPHVTYYCLSTFNTYRSVQISLVQEETQWKAVTEIETSLHTHKIDFFWMIILKIIMLVIKDSTIVFVNENKTFLDCMQASPWFTGAPFVPYFELPVRSLRAVHRKCANLFGFFFISLHTDGSHISLIEYSSTMCIYMWLHFFLTVGAQWQKHTWRGIYRSAGLTAEVLRRDLHPAFVNPVFPKMQRVVLHVLPRFILKKSRRALLLTPVLHQEVTRVRSAQGN